MSTPQLSSGAKQIHSSSCDEFRCLILKPMYVKADRKQPCDRKGAAQFMSVGLVISVCSVEQCTRHSHCSTWVKTVLHVLSF